jgi:hypothetical protein
LPATAWPPSPIFLARFFGDLLGRASGPMRIRLVLQPFVAAVFAIRSGLRDAREGRPPYFWALFARAPGRGQRLREGWRDVGKVLIAAAGIDLIN